MVWSIIGCFDQWNLLDISIFKSLDFFLFKTHFYIWEVFEIKILSREKEEFATSTPKFCFSKREMKSLDPTTN